MPWTKFERSFSGLPVASMSGSLLSSSVIITTTSRRARCEPRQKCGPPVPKPPWWFGSRAMSKRYGSLKCASSRLAEMYHIATFWPLRISTPPKATSRVSVRRMCKTGLAQRTISSAAVIAWPSRSWSHRGVNERGRDILLRLLEPVAAEPEAIVTQLVPSLRERLLRSAVLRVAPGQQTIREVEQARAVGLGDTHHVADDRDGQRRGHFRHELNPALGSDRVDDLSRAAPNRVLGLRHHARREAAIDDGPELRVLGRVGGDHRPDPDAIRVLGVRQHLDAVRGAERFPVAGGGDDVVEAGQRPESAAGVRMLVPRDRPVA